MFSAAFSLAAYADTAVITTSTMYSYFQTYNTSGTWVDLQTPAHWTSDGQVAYCLQTSKDNPYNAAYSSVEGEAIYDDYVLAGLRAILVHGYPVDNGGFDDQAARYATANAIRFFLAENYADGMPQYLNLNVNGDWIRGRPGYEDLFYWSLYLLEMARANNTSTGSAGSLTFSPSEINLTQSGDYFTGTVTLTNGINGTYDLMDDMPSGKEILGHTGAQQETLTIKIPIANANSSYTLCAYGMDQIPTAQLFFWTPSSYSQQRIVTSTMGGSESVFVRGFLKVNTPGAVVEQKGSLKITKTDDGGNPLSGVGFTLYDVSKRAISTKTTDRSGIVTFSDLDLGNYYYAETSALPGYVLDSTQYPVSISSNGQVVKKTMTNTPEKGGLQITKTDNSGNPLSGVGFTLYDSSKRTISTKITDSSGVVSFSDLASGNYYYAETSALPGYVPDTTQYAVSITTSSLLVQKTVTNERIPSKGSLKIVKTDDQGNPLASTGFCLYDSSGTRIKSGSTDSAGILIFADLPLGDYYYQESFAIPGYALDDTMYPISVTEAGQVITKTVTNSKSAGTIKILKTDAESGQPLQGAEFTLMDATYHEVAKKTSDESGLVTFSGLTLGYYYIQETQAPTGYVPYGSIDQVLLDANGKVITKTYTNALARGTLKITKKNGDGELLSGVSFTLYDADKNELTSGTTDANGVVTFENLLVGDYFFKETTELPGYIPNHSFQSARVGYNGAVENVTFTNYLAHGHLRIIKSGENSAPLAGAHFKLTDEAGNLVNEGDTDANGKLNFTMLPIGKYFITETAAPTGYVLDSTPIPFELTRDGEVVTKNISNAKSTGSIVILKTDAETGQPLAGVRFKLLDSTGALISEAVTGTEGKITFTGMALGSYTLQETETAEGYILNSDPIPVQLTENGKTVGISVTNTPSRGNLKLVKKDAYGNTPLAGAGYTLMDETGRKLAEGYTDANGELLFENLLRGDYQVQEFAAPKGYTLDSRIYPVSVTAENVSETRTDLRRSGTLEVRKQDEKNRPLAGATFKLEYSTDNGATWTPVQSRGGDNVTAGGCTSPGLNSGQLTTDSGGSVSFTGLRADSAILYRLTETQAPEGYSLIGTPLYSGTLPVETTKQNTEDSETVDGKTYCYTLYVTATDDPTYRLPETGGSGFGWLSLFMPILALPFIIKFHRRKEDCET